MPGIELKFLVYVEKKIVETLVYVQKETAETLINISENSQNNCPGS